MAFFEFRCRVANFFVGCRNATKARIKEGELQSKMNLLFLQNLSPAFKLSRKTTMTKEEPVKSFMRICEAKVEGFIFHIEYERTGLWRCGKYLQRSPLREKLDELP